MSYFSDETRLNAVDIVSICYACLSSIHHKMEGLLSIYHGVEFIMERIDTDSLLKTLINLD